MGHFDLASAGGTVTIRDVRLPDPVEQRSRFLLDLASTLVSCHSPLVGRLPSRAVPTIHFRRAKYPAQRAPRKPIDY